MKFEQIETTILSEAEQSRQMAMAMLDRGNGSPVLVAQLLHQAGDSYIEFAKAFAKRARAIEKAAARGVP